MKQITFRFLKLFETENMFFSKKKKKNWKSLTDSVSEKILNAFTYITDGEDITDIQLLEIKEEVTSDDSREEEQRDRYRLVFQTVERKGNYTFIGRD